MLTSKFTRVQIKFTIICLFLWRHSLTAYTASLMRFPDHTDTPQLVGILWTRDRSVAETSTGQHMTFITDIHAPHPPEGFEPTIPARERPQTYALSRAVTWIGHSSSCPVIKVCQQHTELFVTLNVLLGKAIPS